MVKARCIDSAVPSTSVFRASPSSAARQRRVKSGRLSRVIASVASAVHNWMVVGSTRMPYDAFDMAVMQELSACCQPLSPLLRFGGEDSLDEGAELGMRLHQVPIIDAAKEVEIERHKGNEARPCIVIINFLHRLVDINGLELPR